MSRYLGFRRARGVLGPDNPFYAGGWVASFPPEVVAIKGQYEIFHIAVTGPAQPRCNFQLWIDTIFYSTSPRGDINDYDPNHPIPVNPGQTVYLYWDTVQNPPPTVTIFCQEPDII